MDQWGLIAGLGMVMVSAVTAIVAWRKAPSESARVLVDASADVVVIQRGLIDDLESRVTALENDRDRIREERDQLRRKNAELTARVRHLEEELAALKGEA